MLFSWPWLRRQASTAKAQKCFSQLSSQWEQLERKKGIKRVVKNVTKASPAAVRKQGSTQKKAVDKRTKVELLPQSVAACLRGITPSQPVTVWTVASDCSGLCTEGLASKLAFDLQGEVQVVHKYASEIYPKRDRFLRKKKDQFKSLEDFFLP